MQRREAGSLPTGDTRVKYRLIIAAGLALGLSGCATYDYVGGGSGGYYHGTPSTQYRYPYGYPYGYDAPGYGYYGSWGYYGPTYIYRPRPVQPPPRPGHRPPPRPGNYQPGRPGNHQPGRPTQPPPPAGNGTNKSPWRNLDGLRPPRNDGQPRNVPRPQQQARPAAVQGPRPAMQNRPAPQRRESPRRSTETPRTQER